MFDGSNTSTTTVKSNWFLIGKLLSPSVIVQGMANSGDSVSIRVSNIPLDQGPPSGSDDGVKHSTLGACTVDTALPVGAAYMWIKAIKDAPSGNPITVYALAQQAK